MATIKSFTSLEQSKKLAEFLPLESADMYYEEICNLPKVIVGNYILHNQCMEDKDYKKLSNPVLSPAWSLAALIELLPSKLFSRHYFLEISKMGDCSTPYEVRYYRFREPLDGADFRRITHISYSSQNLVDACYEMIIKLHELNLL